MKKKGIILAVAILFCIGIGTFAFATFGTSSKINDQLKLANKYLDEGKYQEAVLAFDKVISIDAKNIEARIGLSKAYAGLGKFEEAEKVLKEAININPKEPNTYLELAKLFIKEDKIDDAIAILQKGYDLTQDPDLKKMLDGLNGPVDSKQAIDLLKNYYTDIETGNFDAAYNLLSESSRKSYTKENFRALGDLTLKLTPINGVEVTKEPDDESKNYFQVAVNSYFGGSNTVKKIPLDKKVINENGTLKVYLENDYSTTVSKLRARVGLNLYCMLNNDLSGGKSLISQAIKDDPQNPEPYYALALLDWQNDQFDSSLNNVEKCFELAKDNKSMQVESLNIKGLDLRKKGNDSEARKAFEQALQIDPNAEYVKENLNDISNNGNTHDATAGLPNNIVI